MTALDAAFLEAEDEEPGVSLAIASIAVFEGPPPSTEEFAAVLAGRLPLIPRYRQKVRELPWDVGPPVWVDDPAFDLDYHLRRTALPAPGGDRGAGRPDGAGHVRTPGPEPSAVGVLAGRGPVRLIGGRSSRRCTTAWSTASPGRTSTASCSTSRPNRGLRRPMTGGPLREPSSLRLVAAAAGDVARLPAAQARALAAAVRSPTELARQARATLRGLRSLTGALRPAARSSLSGPLTAQRRFAFARATVDDVTAVRHALGGTFNDVVLAAVTAGFRRLLMTRGELPTQHAVRTLVPVSVRPPGTENVRGNQVSLLLAELPVHLADAEERLVAVRSELTRLKAEHEAEAGAAVLDLAAFEPFAAAAVPVRLAAHLPQRSVVTVTTNVPGPRQPLYALGRRLVEIVPYVPIASTLRFGVAIFSYCGQVTVGITGDYDGAADVWTLAEGMEHGMAELVATAEARLHTTPRPPRRRPR